jgi:serine/threonine protein kinase
MKTSAEPPPAAHPPQRYWPGRLLAVGGMAEIHLARQGAASDGFHKELVIKRLKPELAADPRAVAMFLEEARIGALLNHPNVVQVYDAGQEDAAPFIAMEYIRGEELNQLCRRGLAVSQFLPLEHAVELVRQAAMALGYVHALRDGDGRGLEIVHCDVSPTNLLVTEDGHIKLIDFGIARARGQSWRDEQALPGKLSYMSPEQARRRPLDHRSDIFSLGVVLYEITLGQRLFRGPAHEVLQRLERCEVRPPTFVRRDFPGVLESIIMRALERDPAERYTSAYDMADELDDFLRESARRSGPLRVARYLDELAVAVGGSARAELVAERTRSDEEALDFDRGMFDGYVSGTQSAPVAAWDEWEEESDAVASALSAEVDAVVSKQTENRRQATGNRQPETSESASGPRAADSGSEDAGSLLPVAGCRSPVSVPQAPSEDMARPAPEDIGPARPIIGSPGLGSRGWFLAGLVAGAIALLLLRSVLG